MEIITSTSSFAYTTVDSFVKFSPLFVPIVVFIITALAKYLLVNPNLSERARDVVLPSLSIVLVFVGYWLGLVPDGSLSELVVLALSPTGFHQILKKIFGVNV